ncbi:MAG: hypothetical protein IPO66_20035 [Rhodanobacteraceae bacterium]|nr:hypothetical protein [Rhodanobacteraceae bacterium]
MRLILLLLLIGGGMRLAYAGDGLRFQHLGKGSASDDPTQLADPAPATSVTSIRDAGGGTWWRGEILADVNGPEASGMPTVLYFSGGFHATDTVVLPGGQRIVRNRFGDAGPAWGLRAEVPIVLPSTMGAGSVLYVHVDDPRGRAIAPQLSPLSDYLDRAVARKMVVAASTTALLTLALLAVILRRSFGGAAYGHLAWMAFLMAGYILTFTGELHHLVHNAWLTGWGSTLQRTFAMSAVAFSHLFIVSYLELHRRRPRVARVFSVFVGLQIALALISWVEGREPSPLGALVSNLLILASIPLVLFEAWRAHATVCRPDVMCYGPGARR